MKFAQRFMPSIEAVRLLLLPLMPGNQKKTQRKQILGISQGLIETKSFQQRADELLQVLGGFLSTSRYTDPPSHITTYLR